MQIFKRGAITSIPLDKWFQLVKPRYTYIKVIPDKSIRSNNTINIAKAIKFTFKAINKRIKIEQKKLWFETNFKISYIIDISKNGVDFYFLVPVAYKTIIIEKIREIWTKATLEELESLVDHTKEVEVYQVAYKKEDALSLNVDRRTAEPLNSILSVMEIMQDTDRITVIYNFLPRNNGGWQTEYKETIKKFKDGKPIDRDKSNIQYMGLAALQLLFGLVDSFLNTLGEILGANMEKDKIGLVEALATALHENKQLSSSTNKKKDANILDTQIVVLSDGVDATRRENNGISVSHAFKVLDEDNELISKKVKKDFNLFDYRFDNIDISTFSVEEVTNFIQLPGRSLLRAFNKIGMVKTNESGVPTILQTGTKCLGPVKHKGNITNSYLPNQYNSGNFPLVANGGQGSGKTTFLGNYAKDCTKAGEGLILLDYIKNCELSDAIAKVVPKNRLIIIDLSKESDIQGFGYNEIKIDTTASDYEILKDANIQSQEIMSFIDSISLGEALTGRMRRYLSAAANVSFVIGCTSIKEVIRCLEEHIIRNKYIEKLTDKQKDLLSNEVRCLEELNEWSKVTKKEENEGIVSEIIGTRESKIEGILDRISLLREDFKLKYMYNASLDNNINLVDCMEQGKVVLIKMPESEFTTKLVKNVLVTYFISKVWLASKERGKLHEKPSRCNLIVDELFQAPTCLETLKYILPQSRKYGCKTIISNHYFNQISEIEEALEGSGASYMIMKGTNKNDFSKFDGKIGDFEYSDLEDMEKFSSLNIIFDGDKTHSFISKLPKPIK